MSRYLPLLVLFLFAQNLFGQYQYLRLNNIRETRVVAPLYSPDTEFHTSVKPFNRWKIDSLNLQTLDWYEDLEFDNAGWLPRKLFNESLIRIKGDDYELTIDPIVNFQLGTDPEFLDASYLYVNTRGFNLEGRIGEKFTFQSSYLENQARFPNYVNRYTERHEVIPGQGKARPFGEGGYDFGMPSGEISFTPDRHFSFTLGQGRNFFGEGYRSMMLSDNTFNYPFFRIETEFWKIKYVNLWAQMYDVRPEASVDGTHARKFYSSHYLSINISKRWNWSFFESIVSGDTNQVRGIDISFFNPIIFYRPVEFAVGSRSGNAILGTGTSYIITDGVQAYGQFVLDEFNIDAIVNQNGSWLNKFGWQLGVKSYNTLGIQGLFTRLEYNGARPYTYAHFIPLTNYAHYGQPLAHPWGANFNEGLFHAIYQKDRWEVEFRFHLGVRGLDKDSINYGVDVYRDYYDNRFSDNDNHIGQGERGKYSYIYLRAAWLVNPATGLKFEIGTRIRNLDTAVEPTQPYAAGQSQYYFVGLRTEFFNRYYDF